jgi:hypothetical protein
MSGTDSLKQMAMPVRDLGGIAIITIPDQRKLAEEFSCYQADKDTGRQVRLTSFPSFLKRMPRQRDADRKTFRAVTRGLLLHSLWRFLGRMEVVVH